MAIGNIKDGPLTGVRVVDLTGVLAGPFATKLLADMGAEVIKVEPLEVGAAERHMPLIVDREGVKQSGYSVFLNRGKKSLSVNLKDAKGLEIVKKLIKKSDVLVENFSPGALNRLGLGYEDVAKINPKMIYCSISCFGHYGPYSDLPGYDIIAQGASGWTGMSDPPIIAPVSIGDMTASTHATTAILSALYYREKKGVGQCIDISMMDCLFHLHENVPQWYFFSGRKTKVISIGRLHPGYAPYGVYRGQDGFIVIAALSDAIWQRLVEAMGKESEWLLSDQRTKCQEVRCTIENAPLVHRILEEWISRFKSVREVERVLSASKVPAFRVRSIEELADDPHIRAREMIVRMKQPFVGEIEVYGCPLKMNKTPTGVRGHAPLIGENTREVLSKVLDYDSETINGFYAEGIVYSEPAVERLEKELSN